MPTSIIYLRQHAIKAESRTSVNNKHISVLIKKQEQKEIKVNYSLISHMLERETVNPSAIKFALAIYQPINSLEYE